MTERTSSLIPRILLLVCISGLVAIGLSVYKTQDFTTIWTLFGFVLLVFSVVALVFYEGFRSYYRTTYGLATLSQALSLVFKEFSGEEGGKREKKTPVGLAETLELKKEQILETASSGQGKETQTQFPSPPSAPVSPSPQLSEIQIQTPEVEAPSEEAPPEPEEIKREVEKKEKKEEVGEEEIEIISEDELEDDVSYQEIIEKNF